MVETPKVSTKQMKTWSINEINQFLTHTKGSYLYIAYVLAIYTVMRKGEILGLRWQDIDLMHGRISIVQILVRTENGLFFDTPKTKGSIRSIFITPDVTEILKKHLRQQRKQKLQLGSAYQDHGLVVSTTLSTPMSPDNLRRHFNRMIKESNLPKIRFHDLRHSHATIMLQLGEHPKVVGDRLGHSRSSITLDTYSHVTPNLQKRAAQKFSNSLLSTASTSDQ